MESFKATSHTDGEQGQPAPLEACRYKPLLGAAQPGQRFIEVGGDVFSEWPGSTFFLMALVATHDVQNAKSTNVPTIPPEGRSVKTS